MSQGVKGVRGATREAGPAPHPFGAPVPEGWPAAAVPAPGRVRTAPLPVFAERDEGCGDVFLSIPEDASGGLPVWKRTMDILLGTVALLVHLPLMLIIGLGIKLVSPGPVFFVQERVGYRGRRFPCIKFRSMRHRTSVETHERYLEGLLKSDKPMAKLDGANDPRLIPVGRFMRAIALDELPQLFNVIRGDMSLVGPRPAIPYEYERYAPEHRLRFLAVPGMTGLWQVSGKNRTTFSRMVELDVKYALEKSLWLDLKILALTPKVLLEQFAEAIQGLRRRRKETA